MADSFNKKEREKKRQKRRKDKLARKEARKNEEPGKRVEFMYMDEDGNLTETPPDPTKKKQEFDASLIAVSTPKKGDEEKVTFVKTGFCKFFNTEKGYGFLVDNATKDSFFVHANSLSFEIKENDKVTFEIGSGPKGPVAVKVNKI